MKALAVLVVGCAAFLGVVTALEAILGWPAAAVLGGLIVVCTFIAGTTLLERRLDHAADIARIRWQEQPALPEHVYRP